MLTDQALSSSSVVWRNPAAENIQTSLPSAESSLQVKEAGANWQTVKKQHARILEQRNSEGSPKGEETDTCWNWVCL